MLAAITGCADAQPPGAPLVRVPEDAPTITAALAAVAENGLVLIGPGSYPESVTVSTPGVTIRGAERSTTVIDGEGLRPHGIVVVADGVTVENLTVTGATFYGVLVTGVHEGAEPIARGVSGYEPFDPAAFPPLQRFAIDHVTAYNNGLYGLYAFNAQHGAITNSYASGSADSGIYVGQCRECDILVSGNVAEHNAVGFENANASDSVFVVGNRFSRNRIGLTLLSDYQEAFVPQRGNLVAGNVISDNAEPESPAHAEGGFGIGIGIGAGTENLLQGNLITGNPRAGVLLSSVEDLPPAGNLLRGNTLEGNGVDLANTASSRAPAVGNCSEDPPRSVLPAGFFARCAQGVVQPSVGAEALPEVPVPPGISFLKIAAPPAQPSLAGPGVARVLPARIGPIDAATVPAANRALLLDRIR